MIASTGFAVLNSKSDSINSDFFYMFLTTEVNIMTLQKIAESSTSAYPSISPNDILSLNCALPKDRSRMKNICKKFDSILATILIKGSENKQLRDWLFPMLMNGQVTV